MTPEEWLGITEGLYRYSSTGEAKLFAEGAAIIRALLAEREEIQEAIKQDSPLRLAATGDMECAADYEAKLVVAIRERKGNGVS